MCEKSKEKTLLKALIMYINPSVSEKLINYIVEKENVLWDDEWLKWITAGTRFEISGLISAAKNDYKKYQNSKDGSAASLENTPSADAKQWIPVV